MELFWKNIQEDLFLRYLEFSFDNLLKNFSFNQSKEFFIFEAEKLAGAYFLYLKNISIKELYEEIWITTDLKFHQYNFYQLGLLKNSRSIRLLEIIDSEWTDHLERMNYIKETINWRSYGQQNPLVEYNMEAFKSFQEMFEEIRSSMIYYFLNNPISY